MYTVLNMIKIKIKISKYNFSFFKQAKTTNLINFKRFIIEKKILFSLISSST